MAELRIKDFLLNCKTNNFRTVQEKIDHVIVLSKLMGYIVDVEKNSDSAIRLIIKRRQNQHITTNIIEIRFYPFSSNSDTLSHIDVFFRYGRDSYNLLLDDLEPQLDKIESLL